MYGHVVFARASDHPDCWQRPSAGAEAGSEVISISLHRPHRAFDIFHLRLPDTANVWQKHVEDVVTVAGSAAHYQMHEELLDRFQ
jgi:hypothetical protein